MLSNRTRLLGTVHCSRNIYWELGRRFSVFPLLRPSLNQPIVPARTHATNPKPLREKVSPDNTQVAAQARTNYYEPEATDPYPATRRSYPCCNPENHQKLLDGARSPETTGDHESPLAHARETTREILIGSATVCQAPTGVVRLAEI